MSKTTESIAFKRLTAVMKDVDGDQRQIIRHLQDQVEYLVEKCRIYEEVAVEKNDGKAITLSDTQKKRLAVKGKTLNAFLLGEIENSFAPSTIFDWYRKLVGQKYNSVSQGQKRRGRPAISPEIIEKVLEFARKNPSWGYERIASVMLYLDFRVSASTVRKILDDYGIIPDPEQRTRGDWEQFWNTQEAVTAAIDYAQTEIVTPEGLVRYGSLFCMDCGSKEVVLGGIAHNPTSEWTTQIARNWCDMWDGFLLGKKYLIRDNDVTFTRAFDKVFKSIGITVKRIRPYAPAMNSRMENFIRALKTECLNKIIFRSEAELRYAIEQFLEYYNHYRPHTALGGKMIKPYEQSADGQIIEVSFLGGLFHGYRREKLVA